MKPARRGVVSQDQVLDYARDSGFSIETRTVLVEGGSDAKLCRLAARLELELTGIDLLEGLSVVAAGEGNRGGAGGVVRELTTLRSLARNVLRTDGRPLYRFIGLVDDDKAGREAVRAARTVDSSILEYKDLFRLQPLMVASGNLDPKTLRAAFVNANARYRGLDWELEDLLPSDIIGSFLSENPTLAPRCSKKDDKVHWKFTWDAKHKLHRYVEDFAMGDDLRAVVNVIRALRYYLVLPQSLRPRARP